VRCCGENKQGRRCKQTCILPIKRRWTCIDHTLDYEACSMEATKARTFYLISQGGSNVEIRSKFYIKGKIHYLIERDSESLYVNKDEFYTIPSEYQFIVIH
jgi:hypothetical protein